MFRCLKVLLIGVVLTATSIASQPLMHMAASYEAFEFMKVNTDIPTWVLLPTCGIVTHLACDRAFRESSLGGLQIEIAGIKGLTMLLSAPEEKKSDFFWSSFWGVAPDIADKWFNLGLFHNSPEQPLIPLNRDETEMSEALSMLVISYTFVF